jgi:uncharacterized protein (TIGR02145 family)
MVSFTLPSSDGGSAITGYTVTSSPGSFTGTGGSSPITVTGLTNGTAYTFTVIATNAVGSSSASSASSAVTPATVPGAPTSVTAVPGNNLASVSFTAPSSTGGSAITGYTVTSSPGSFTGTGGSSPITVTGLTNGTTYTFTVIATNAVGSSSSSSASSAVTPVNPCPAATVTDRNNYTYNTVPIGSHCWIQSNLRVITYNNGDTIPLDVSGTTTGSASGQSWSGLITGAKTVYQHDNNNLTTYGYLYNWYAATDSRGICPTGWHVPSENDWNTLRDYLGGQSVAGLKMKSSSGWVMGNGNNDSNFSGLPAGNRSENNGSFGSKTFYGWFWSSGQADASNANGRQLDFGSDILTPIGSNKKTGFSVRCLKD